MILLLAAANVTFVRTFLITDSKFKCTVTFKAFFIIYYLLYLSYYLLYLLFFIFQNLVVILEKNLVINE